LGKARVAAGARASVIRRAVVRKVQSHNVALANIAGRRCLSPQALKLSVQVNEVAAVVGDLKPLDAASVECCTAYIAVRGAYE
jgi:hypothetical protein